MSGLVLGVDWWPKTTWNGQHQRMQLLREAGIVLDDTLEEAGEVPVADVLDAAVVAWSARRYADGAARSLPADPPDPRREVIWL